MARKAPPTHVWIAATAALALTPLQRPNLLALAYSVMRPGMNDYQLGKLMRITLGDVGLGVAALLDLKSLVPVVAMEQKL